MPSPAVARSGRGSRPASSTSLASPSPSWLPSPPRTSAPPRRTVSGSTRWGRPSAWSSPSPAASRCAARPHLRCNAEHQSEQPARPSDWFRPAVVAVSALPRQISASWAQPHAAMAGARLTPREVCVADAVNDAAQQLEVHLADEGGGLLREAVERAVAQRQGGVVLRAPWLVAGF